MTKSQKPEEKYRAIFEWSRDAIIVVDQKGEIIEINKSGVDIFGYESNGEFLSIKSPAEHFINKKDLSLLQDIVNREGHATEFETQLVRKGGYVFDALVTSSMISDDNGKSSGYLVIIRDITRRKRAQEKIEIQNSRLAILNTISMTVSNSLNLNEVLDHTIDTIIEILEPDSVRVYMIDKKGESLNLAAYKGLSAKFITKSHMRRRKVGDGLLGQTVLTRETKVVDNFLRAEDPYVDSILEEGLKSTVYIPLVSKDKPVGAMCVSSHSEFKFSADFVGFLTAIGNQIGVAIDNANLYENIKKAYQEVTEAQEHVIQTEKLASLGKLAATIAHEINNPISVVLTYVKLMKKLIDRDRFNVERLDDISRYLSTMASETARCGEIVKNLLAFSRHSAIQFESHNIEEIIDRTLTLIAHDLEMKEMQLAREIEPNLPDARCDFKQIQQAFLNLVINASEAMEKGGTLTVTAERSQRDGFLMVAISDTGFGIPKKDLKNIFEPFFTTKEEAKGVGLGLSVVYGIITRHEGSIEVKSKLGKGSTFEILLPIARSNEEGGPAPEL